ncbi:MAG TPA: NUDIX hydrolase [Kiritimatiellia bacterium]|nr:NUDIX hydrolase [Kiritimatiellia bacterium]HMP33653.1 NUDIX hydrolase [Kiritimatiellia bacterium]
MTTWKLLDRTTALDCGRYLRVDQHRIQLPDGRVIEHWPVVITPDYVNILARDPQERFVLFRQTKYMAPAMSLAPPGGYLDPGEDPLTAARRELREETGYTAADHDWHHLGSFVVDSNRGCGNAHLYLALNATPTTCIASDDLEEQTLVLTPRAELEALLTTACPILSATLLFTLAFRHLDQSIAR